MSTDERLVLRLEVDLDAEPITGILAQRGHAGRPFTGWLALTDAIESIRGAEDGADDTYPDGADDQGDEPE